MFLKKVLRRMRCLRPQQGLHPQQALRRPRQALASATEQLMFGENGKRHVLLRAGGTISWRAIVLVTHLSVRPSLEEEAQRVASCLALRWRSCEAEGGAPLLVDGIDVRVQVQEEQHDLHQVELRGLHQWGPALESLLDICSLNQETPALDNVPCLHGTPKLWLAWR